MWNALMTKASIALMTEFPTLFALSNGTGTGGHEESTGWTFDNFVDNAKENAEQHQIVRQLYIFI